MWADKAGNAIGFRGCFIFADALEVRNFRNSVPLPVAGS
jgi:hypothetical protein